MKAPYSSYLASIEPGLLKLIESLREQYDYVSVLSTDSVGFRISVSQRNVSIENETMTTERGSVVRVWKDGLYSEAAFNRFDPAHPDETLQAIQKTLERQMQVLSQTGTKPYRTKALEDTPFEGDFAFETQQLPETCDVQSLISSFISLSNEGMRRGQNMVDFHISAQSTHISKLFLTPKRTMRQSYVYSEGNLIPIAAKNGKNSYTHIGVSGRYGPELFSEFAAHLDESLTVCAELLDADAVEPGEYDVITSPEVTGLIAHEAFGHGVEMDMFVKGRALGQAYIGKRVGSDQVTMHEGALCAENVTTYAFDDEGTLAGDVTEIDRGILKTGIADALSALRLGIAPTGNGKRQNFEHKAYTRMTNTLFDSGEATLEEMIASVEHGYLLCGMRSGMEDPKHWGIQCIVERGYEILNGKLTGKVVAPIVMTGYVPDLLGSVSMASRDREVFGCGGCGKGYKEWVKVADGGPYLKCRARLG